MTYITFFSAYHGHLLSTMEISPYKFNQSENIDVKKPDYVHIVRHALALVLT